MTYLPTRARTHSHLSIRGDAAARATARFPQFPLGEESGPRGSFSLQRRGPTRTKAQEVAIADGEATWQIRSSPRESMPHVY